MGRVIGLAQGIAVIADPNLKPEIVPKRDQLMKSSVVTHLPREKNARAPERHQEGRGKPYTAAAPQRRDRPARQKREKRQKRSIRQRRETPQRAVPQPCPVVARLLLELESPEKENRQQQRTQARFPDERTRNVNGIRQ